MAKKSKKNKNTEAENQAALFAEEASDLSKISDSSASISSELMADISEDIAAELGGDLEVEAAVFAHSEEVSDSFLPEATDDQSDTEELITSSDVDLEGSELEGYESAEIDEVEFVEEERAESIIESILFASDRPVSLASIKEVFKGTNIRKDKIRRILDNLAVEYASGRRGVTLEEITGGYQIRTKIDNMNFLKRTVKSRPFKLSGPALETLAIVAYKQPVVKSEIDQIRGVESGHLLRALMEKGLCHFEGKAENLPGRPMQYGTTRRFLEIFGLRHLKELPTLSQIDELLPEGIGEEEEQKPTLSMVTDAMSEEVKDVSYSQGEEELGKIENELNTISTSSDFFEQEKIRQKQKRDAEKAQDIRDALTVGEEVSKRDVNWLKKYEESLALAEAGHVVPQNFVEDAVVTEAVAHAEASVDAGALVEESSREDVSFDEADHIEDEIPFTVEADDDGSDHVSEKIELSDEEVEDLV